jgi:hypothetical protein
MVVKYIVVLMPVEIYRLLSNTSHFSPVMVKYVGQKATNWPHRLSVRTSGFHPGKRSSTLLGVTIVVYTTKDTEVYPFVLLIVTGIRILFIPVK